MVSPRASFEDADSIPARAVTTRCEQSVMIYIWAQGKHAPRSFSRRAAISCGAECDLHSASRSTATFTIFSPPSSRAWHIKPTSRKSDAPSGKAASTFPPARAYAEVIFRRLLKVEGVRFTLKGAPSARVGEMYNLFWWSRRSVFLQNRSVPLSAYN